MGVATHLGIDIAEYDRRIRTFIPDYEEMLDVVAAHVPPRAQTIADLGVGTGALAARCLRRAAAARVVGIDVDREMMKLAERRLRGQATLLYGTFLRTPLPKCDAVVASFALHHIRTRPAKAGFYGRIAAALRPNGAFLTADCHPARDRALAREQHGVWQLHLQRSYTKLQAAGFLADWSQEDVYVPLESEIRLIASAGLAVEILWRKGAFAVLRGANGRRARL
jgi:ubiquinone/menaquinone biosynthesis C-methylase UbiE